MNPVFGLLDKIRNVRLIVAFCLYAGNALGEGICIPEPIKSSVVEGTIFFGSEQHPLQDVRVEISGYAYGAPVVASSTTGKDGSFSVTGVRAGRYWLNARHPVV